MAIQPLVSTSWLHEQMGKPDWSSKFYLLDATWDLPIKKRDFIAEYKAGHIPGARYFSLSECRNKEASLPNTVPSSSHFENYVSSLGVENNHHVILYDNSERFGLFSAPRAWWLFHIMGHENVSIVDGGLPKWKKEGLPLEQGEQASVKASQYKATYNTELIRDLQFMKTNMESNNPVQVLDARPNGRFRGLEPEPRPDIPSGHIPNSVSAPFFGCFDRENNVMLSKDAVKEYLTSKEIDLNGNMVTTCGSGVTASVLLFAIYYATGRKVPLFDGSWFEWQLNTPNNDKWQIREKKE